MNSVSRSRVRPGCRLVRRWCALVGEAAPRHAVSCADCRRYFQAGDALETSLRREAAPWAEAAPEPSADFEQRLLRSIREETAAPTPGLSRPITSSPWRSWMASGAALAACAVIVGVGYFRPGPAGVSRGESSGAADAAVVLDAVRTLSDGWVDTVIPSAGALVTDNPLQREMDSIYADARSALGFLAWNFLPSAAATRDVPSGRRI